MCLPHRYNSASPIPHSPSAILSLGFNVPVLQKTESVNSLFVSKSFAGVGFLKRFLKVKTFLGEIVSKRQMVADFH